MNLPNKITIARVVLIPLMVIIPFFHLDNELIWGITLGNLLCLVIFLLASFTDFLDGHLARKNNMVTNFGKFLDPLADKLLVAAALIMLVESGIIPAWIPIIILAREFSVSGIRMLAASEGKVIAASWYGKVKTVSQMVAISLAFLCTSRFWAWTSMPWIVEKSAIPKDAVFNQINTEWPMVQVFNGSCLLNLLMSIAMIFAVGATIFSGIDYFKKSKDIIMKSK